MTEPGKAISGTAFATLLLIALMMGANHVAARIAFNNGVDVATAVVFRSAVTALVVVAILGMQRVQLRFTARHKRMLPAIGLLIGVQSLCLYSAWRGCRWRWRCWPSTPTRCGPRYGPRCCTASGRSARC